ncbi:PREDICTED: protein EPIDERMAL PATTERNING FACTOR 2-like [Tarenaya hassleriana]|uniref:protein EPIDERMAL PATTERNING FACTOR 2-like n=1 Tax=Tarenaya hassleriana TaxID=28532 RepID=UPI00053C1931|nr:PREDICTED: protein EPIDERMAL PATTERNING FACTOR 2-like [Tarenaya hassleriana]
MKKFLHACTLMLLFIVFVVFSSCPTVTNCIRTPPLELGHPSTRVQTHHNKETKGKRGVEMEMYPSGSGSSLPDCSYACGPCSPCKRVMISFKCSVAESCSVIYRCTCKGRYYHVPSRA